MTVTLIGLINKYVGLSGDVKPTDGPVGSEFLESDTDKRYVFHAGAWNEITEAGVAVVTGTVDIEVGGQAPQLDDTDKLAVSLYGKVSAAGDTEVLLDALGRMIMGSAWAPSLQVDEAADDSDKKLTVPASTEWHIYSIWVELVSTATVGDRQLEIQIQDASDDVIASIMAGVVQSASLTRNYLFAPGSVDLVNFRDSDTLSTSIPAMLILPAGYDIRIFDNNAVDAAADDMVVQMLVGARSV